MVDVPERIAADGFGERANALAEGFKQSIRGLRIGNQYAAQRWAGHREKAHRGGGDD
jgi:hypothetical protein